MIESKKLISKKETSQSEMLVESPLWCDID